MIEPRLLTEPEKAEILKLLGMVPELADLKDAFRAHCMTVDHAKAKHFDNLLKASSLGSPDALAVRRGDPAAIQRESARIEAQLTPKGRRMKFEIYTDENDKHRWRLTSSNGEIVAASTQGFADKRTCKKNAYLTFHGLSEAVMGFEENFAV